jgi:hypothetical protein
MNIMFSETEVDGSAFCEGIAREGYGYIDKPV